MKPIHFKGETTVLQSPEGSGFAPVHMKAYGDVYISKWKMSWTERLHAIFYGSVWINIHYNKSGQIFPLSTQSIDNMLEKCETAAGQTQTNVTE
ncbi:hypothetical protein Barb6_03189 [Bacteroidales bacterium Barb6]|nr:hypothetical protein Barb6_03189 [Bacteroidales bacterium Barb6]